MYSTILLAPLVGALIGGLCHRWIGVKLAQYIPTGLLLLSAVPSWIALYDVMSGFDGRVTLFRWIESGALSTDWAIRVDTLTAVMLVVVTTVSSLVHVYSIGYMEHDPGKPRFFSYLSLFTFAMLMLVTSDNFLQMFFGWEGVGLASYLLIGFWFKKETANAAAMKAFIVNRVGDFGFALGIFGVFAVFGSLDFDTVFAATHEMAADGHGPTFHFLGMELDTLNTLCVLLFIGAMGKSAQFLLHTWLPDAMEGPTPVSALIHAATMVTAGVFLVCRLSPMFEHAHGARDLVAFVGATTAFFAATIGLVQNDIKRIVAYSTCSQLGYMFFAAGVGVYQAAMFHLFTHAFFKALLFLGSGSVIHAMHEEQDIRRMGGLWNKIPITYLFMIVGTLALTGFPLTAGFYSKDMIIESAFAGHGSVAHYAFIMGVVAALMTSFYSWRLIFKVFHGPRRGDMHAHEHAHESPPVMLIPMAVLVLGSLIMGIVFYESFVGGGAEFFWREAIYVGHDNHVMHEAHYVPFLVKAAPFIVMVIGFSLAWLFYIRRLDLPTKLRGAREDLYQFLLNKWWFDEAYDFLFVRPAQWLGRFLWKKGDGAVIDGTINGLSMQATPFMTRLYQRAQNGYVFTYAFAMIIGVALVIGFAAAKGS